MSPGVSPWVRRMRSPSLSTGVAVDGGDDVAGADAGLRRREAVRDAVDERAEAGDLDGLPERPLGDHLGRPLGVGHRLEVLVHALGLAHAGGAQVADRDQVGAVLEVPPPELLELVRLDLVDVDEVEPAPAGRGASRRARAGSRRPDGPRRARTRSSPTAWSSPMPARPGAARARRRERRSTGRRRNLIRPPPAPRPATRSRSPRRRAPRGRRAAHRPGVRGRSRRGRTRRGRRRSGRRRGRRPRCPGCRT